MSGQRLVAPAYVECLPFLHHGHNLQEANDGLDTLLKMSYTN